MNFFRINLNKLEDPSLALRAERRGLLGFWAIAVLFAGLGGLVAYQYRLLDGKVSHLAGLRDNLKKQIESLERDAHYISEEDVRDLHDLDQQRIFWTRKLEVFSKQVGDSIALTGIQFAHGKLYLRGICEAGEKDSKFGLISGFIDGLKADADFSRNFNKVEFVASSRFRYQNQDMLNFEILCRLQ